MSNTRFWHWAWCILFIVYIPMALAKGEWGEALVFALAALHMTTHLMRDKANG